jgi:hypothetical protein
MKCILYTSRPPFPLFPLLVTSPTPWQTFPVPFIPSFFSDLSPFLHSWHIFVPSLSLFLSGLPFSSSLHKVIGNWKRTSTIMSSRAGLSQNYDSALKDMTRNYEKRSFLKPHCIWANFDHNRWAPLDQVRIANYFNDFWSFLVMDEWLLWPIG